MGRPASADDAQSEGGVESLAVDTDVEPGDEDSGGGDSADAGSDTAGNADRSAGAHPNPR
jgi:hypothetical protein